MERVRVVYHPCWEGPIENWAKAFIKKNYWRISSYYTYEDIYQDAYLKFETCKYRYPQVTEVRHFMSLFQRSLINHIHTAALERRNYVPATNLERTGENGETYNPAFDELAEEPIALLIQELTTAPKEIQDLLIAIHTNEEVIRRMDKVQKSFKGVEDVLELNKKLCAIIKVNPSKVDLVAQLKEYLGFNGSTI